MLSELLLVLALLIAFGLSWLFGKLTITLPSYSTLAKKAVVHDPGRSVPTLGGVGIYLSFSLTYLLFIPSSLQFEDAKQILFGMLIILIVGVIDDIVELKAGQKSLGILLATAWLYWTTDIRISSLAFLGYTWEFTWLSFLVTFIWIYLFTNSINLIDGLDGLATGVSIISLSAFAVIGFFFTATSYRINLTFILLFIAVLLGFLILNFYPAKIFLGDSGSLLIGYTIGLLAIHGLKNAALFSLLIPVMVMIIPISDVAGAIFRRWRKGQSLTTRDHRHLHHMLLKLGFSHKQVVLLIYGLALIGVAFAILFSFYSTWWMLIAIILLSGLLAFVIQRLIKKNMLK